MFKCEGSIILYILVVSLSCAFSTKCESFNNILLKTKVRNGDDFNITSFSGVIERISFGDFTLTEVNVRQQNVQDIGAECVRHMVQLKTLVFWRCPIRTLSPGAFRNLPRLTTLQISYGNLTTVPAGVFEAVPALRQLRLHDNAIHTIEKGAFSNLHDLKKLYLAKNKLKIWDISWFQDTTNLELLDVQGNQIEVIPARAFFGMSNLKKIILDYNEIRNIEHNSFMTIATLEYLGLRHNRLKELNENAFPYTLSVKCLLIDANYLNFLSDGVLKKLSVKYLTLDGNPWKCPCLERVNFWIYTKNVTLKSSDYCSNPNIPVCSYPRTYSTTCLDTIDEEMTKRYIAKLKNISDVNRLCARLD